MTLEDTDCVVLLALRLTAHLPDPANRLTHYARVLTLWQHEMGAAAERDYDIMQKARLFRYVTPRPDPTAQRNALEVAARPLVLCKRWKDIICGGQLVVPPAPE